MFNAAIKPIAIASILLALSSCGKSQETADAEALLAQASEALEAGDADRANILIDSLQAAFPAQTDVQREALTLRPKVMEALIVKKLVTTDSLIAEYSALNERLAPKMKKVTDKELLEPYYVPTSVYNAEFMNTTGVQPRVDEIGRFFIISSVCGRGLRHESLSFKSAAGEVSTGAIPSGSDMNFVVGNNEMITFSPEQCDTVGQFVTANLGSPVTVTFKGKKNFSQKLTPAQAQAFADAYAFSKSIIQARDLTVQREKLDRQLQVARDQQARNLKE